MGLQGRECECSQPAGFGLSAERLVQSMNSIAVVWVIRPKNVAQVLGRQASRQHRIRRHKTLSSEAAGLPGRRAQRTRHEKCTAAQGNFPLKRLFDLALAIILSGVLALPILIVAVLVRLTSPGPALYWSDRVGRNNRIFRMPKFRSMRMGTPAVATHLLVNPEAHLTPIGPFLRKSSLDELPQLWSILAGDMSFVGPRPALYNQADLISLRTAKGVDALLPGLTGWAQINGRDELPIPDKVELDAEYLRSRSLWFDIRILWLTGVKVLRRDGVSH